MASHSTIRSSAVFARYTLLGILAVLLALPAPGQAGAQARKIELGDLQKIVDVSNPAISLDGKFIVIIVSRANWDEDRYDSQLVLVDIATGAQRPLTNIRRGLSSPQFSPSGDRLAFLAETVGDEGRKEPPRASLRAVHQRRRAAADHQRASGCRAVCLAPGRLFLRLRRT